MLFTGCAVCILFQTTKNFLQIDRHFRLRNLAAILLPSKYRKCMPFGVAKINSCHFVSCPINYNYVKTRNFSWPSKGMFFVCPPWTKQKGWSEHRWAKREHSRGQCFVILSLRISGAFAMALKSYYAFLLLAHTPSMWNRWNSPICMRQMN